MSARYAARSSQWRINTRLVQASTAKASLRLKEPLNERKFSRSLTHNFQHLEYPPIRLQDPPHLDPSPECALLPQVSYRNVLLHAVLDGFRDQVIRPRSNTVEDLQLSGSVSYVIDPSGIKIMLRVAFCSSSQDRNGLGIQDPRRPSCFVTSCFGNFLKREGVSYEAIGGLHQ